MTTVNTNNIEWMADGACVKLDVDQPRKTSMFFRDGETDEEDKAIRATSKQYRAAKRVCDSCEVRETCLEWALHHRECCGMWGGKTRAERRRILRQRAKDARIELVESETPGVLEIW